MHVIRFATALPLLSLLLVGCERHAGARSPLSPSPPSQTQEPRVAEARWIRSGPELAAAIRLASNQTAAKQALVEAPQPNLHLQDEDAIAAVGRGTDDLAYRVTILPYADPADPNRATFITLIDRAGEVLCQRSELLASPTRVSPDSGYVPVVWLGRTLYLREGTPYRAQPSGMVHRSPERVNRMKFLQCFSTVEPVVGDVVRDVCGSLPQYPQCTAVGNAVGTALVAIGCGVYAWEK